MNLRFRATKATQSLFKTISGFGRSLVDRKPTLASKTLLDMALKVTGVILVSSWASYSHVMMNLEQQTQSRLQQYISELGRKQSAAFLLTQANSNLMKREFLARLKRANNKNLQPRFDQLFSFKPDGTFRTHREYYEGKLQPDGSMIRYMNGVIFRHNLVNDHLRQQLVISYDLLSSYAPPLRNELESIYMFIPDGSGMAYSPGLAWNLEASATQDFSQQEWAYTANVKHNPSRSVVWTGLYYEPTFKTYLVTCLTPIDLPGYAPITIGSDLSINELLQQTVDDHLEGAYNIIFRADGRLVAHPKLMKELESTQGNLLVSDAQDDHLNRIFNLAKNNNASNYVIDNETDHEYLAITKIEGPNWYLVTVYPKSLLSEFAFKTVQFFLISSAIALIIEIGLLFFVLRQQIAKPLAHLLKATDRIAGGDFNINMDVTRQDELGRLGNAFNHMASQLNHSFMKLEEAKIDLEHRVENRTLELKKALAELRRSQLQIVQGEKMAALGQLVAGIAHEINNPINFIHGNLEHVDRYTKDLLELLVSYGHFYPNPPEALQTLLKTAELDFLTEDLNKTLQSMKVGTNRICEIIKSLRNFSRLDEAAFKSVDIHEGLDNTLLILQHRLKANSSRSEIKIVKEYDSLPLVECYAGQLNQVFMNILSNAIDALDEHQQLLEEEGEDHTPIIRLHTKLLQNGWVSIEIIDNGTGISESVRASIFDPFFTTKPVGQGTGLGLSISYQIITERHRGHIFCESHMGQGTKFVIEIPVQQTIPHKVNGSASEMCETESKSVPKATMI